MGWWRLKLILWLWPKRAVGSTYSCANRRARTTTCGSYEITLGIRDTSRPDGYERTELLRMLREVRKHEAEQRWRVPEPAGTGQEPS